MNLEDENKVVQIVDKARDRIRAAWTKQESLSENRDFLAYLKIGTEGTVEMVVASRTTLFPVLEADGMNLSDKAFDPIREPAMVTAHGAVVPAAAAIWVLVNLEGRTHIMKMCRMAQGGSA